MKIFVDEYIFFHEDMKTLMEKYHQFTFVSDIKEANDCEIMISMPNKIRKEIIGSFSNLKWIQLLTAGYDQIDLNDLALRNIKISYAKDVFSIQIAEDVISKILFLNRKLGVFYEQQKSSLWKNHDVYHEIFQSTVGIIGAGSIGNEVAKRMKAFGAKVIGYRRKKVRNKNYDIMYHDLEGLDHLIQHSDYIIISIPLSKDTYHLIRKRELFMMKKNALLINVARGSIIHQDDLIYALENNIIRGAGLDVTDPEPLPKTSKLWNLKNVIITPHNASASPYLYKRIVLEIEDALNSYLNHIQLDNLIEV
jgi:phosphoglycerate dehydrogenase-like enzyme